MRKRFGEPFLSCQAYEKMVQWTIFECKGERMTETEKHIPSFKKKLMLPKFSYLFFLLCSKINCKETEEK
jgi:hypothetical protein